MIVFFIVNGCVLIKKYAQIKEINGKRQSYFGVISMIQRNNHPKVYKIGSKKREKG